MDNSSNSNTGSGDDELLSQFISITGALDPARAQSYLEMAGMNLEMAVSLYMEHTGVDSTADGSASGGGGGGGVRAPDQTRRMQLLEQDSGMMMMGSYPQQQQQLNDDVYLSAFASNLDARQVVNQAAAAASSAHHQNHTTTSDDDDDDDDDENAMRIQQQQQQQQPPNSLCDMFAPPTHLLHRGGGFQGARNVAKEARRWLLVNLQRDSDFACHALNRDVWRDELVENLIREGFIFWQSLDTSPDGQNYVERYNVNAFPHIGFLDPRTGRLVHRKEGWTQVNPLTCEQFAEMAADFCSKHSLDQAPKRSHHHDDDEEEQLQAAIRASMMQQDDDDNDDSYQMEDEEDNDSVVEEEKMPKKPTLEDELATMDVGDEPTDNAISARVMIRMPDGKRLIRKFQKQHSVKIIYAFVAQSKSEDKPFELKAGFPPKDLIEKIDCTIEECGLAGDSITVCWKS